MATASPQDRARALCAFEVLAMLVVASLAPEDGLNFYPSFAKHPADFADEAVIELRAAGEARSAIFPLDDDQLRVASGQRCPYPARTDRIRPRGDARGGTNGHARTSSVRARSGASTAPARDAL
jgi:hypothetical protein